MFRSVPTPQIGMGFKSPIQGESSYTIRVQRSEIDLSPDFQDADAFRIDCAEGARIRNLDGTSRSDAFIWRDE